MLQIPDEKLKEAVVQEGLLTPEQFDRVSEDALRLGQAIPSLLISRNIISLNYYNNLLSGYFGVPFADLEARAVNEELLKNLPEMIARQKRAIVFGKENDESLSVALSDPSDLSTIAFLEKYLKVKIKPYFASEADLNKGFSIYSRAVAEDYKNTIKKNVLASLEKRITGEQGATEVPIVDIINNILSYALSLRASDIHAEIFEDLILVRYRIDGILHEIIEIPKEVYPAITARIKLLGAMKIDEHYKPQDGRFRYKVGSDMVDIRVSIIPTFYGEKIEMRLLASTSKPLSFAELGMLPETAKIVEENVRKSYGMALVTGPTGSGKSTTLYSVLSILNRPEVNIVTIEDPIEYDMKYVNQTQVNVVAGITFASGLRAILRQDPNIIMVGEIRDEETADIAVQASLTGHMVLSSLHTNDAPTAIPRLFDMKIQPFLVSAVLTVIVAQRLVRGICKTCIYSHAPSDYLTKLVKDEVVVLGIQDRFAVPKLVYSGKGCAACNGIGYKGRMGIFEVVNVSEEMRKLILSPEFSLDNLRKLARKEGMISMFEDGLKKVELGMTTVEEVLRVVRE